MGRVSLSGVPDPYTLKANDTATPLVATLYDANGQPVPLPSGTPVFFAMRPAVVGMPGPTFKKAARIVNEQGKVAYDWAPEDVGTPGPFKAEWEVSTANGPLTVPSDGYIDLIILPDVG